MNQVKITSLHKGFTIVELLIVVVVIAILASITVVSYNGITERAKTTKLVSAVKNYEKIFQLYKIQFNSFPYIEDNQACLGEPSTYPTASGFTAGECGMTEGSSYVSTLNTELKKVSSSLPDASFSPVEIRTSPTISWSLRGAFFSDDTNEIFYAVKGNACPLGVVNYFALSNTSLCAIQLGLE